MTDSVPCRHVFSISSITNLTTSVPRASERRRTTLIISNLTLHHVVPFHFAWPFSIPLAAAGLVRSAVASGCLGGLRGIGGRDEVFRMLSSVVWFVVSLISSMIPAIYSRISKHYV